MCPWVGPHAASIGRQLRGLPSRVEYPSKQGVLLSLVYRTTSSRLCLEVRGLSAWQATPSWTVYRLACHRLLPWLRMTFAMVPDAAWPWGTAPAAGPVGQLGRPSARNPWGDGFFPSLGCPMCARVSGVLGHLAPVHWCACSVCCVACAVSRASWLLFTGVLARCVVLRVRCPGPLGSCSPVCTLSVLCRTFGVLDHLAPVQRCTRLVCCVACAVSWATWLLFTGVPPRCVVFSVRCPGPLGVCSLVCPRGEWCRVCGALGHLAPVQRCACLVLALLGRCPVPLGSCSPLWPLSVLCCVCGVLGHLARVHRCARSVPCISCAVSCATWLSFTRVPALCVVLRLRCPGPLGPRSRVCTLSVLCCVCGILGHLAPAHRCARSIRCFAYAVSWATWLLFTGVPARCVVLRLRCAEPLGFCSPVSPLGVFCSVYRALGHLAPVHRCARLLCCVARALS